MDEREPAELYPRTAGCGSGAGADLSNVVHHNLLARLASGLSDAGHLIQARVIGSVKQ
jgi:hypothetical protein